MIADKLFHLKVSMSISRLFTGVINCFAGTKKAHIINISNTHMMNVKFLSTHLLMKRFHVKRSPVSSSLTIRLWMDGTVSLFFKVNFSLIFSMPVS